MANRDEFWENVDKEKIELKEGKLKRLFSEMYDLCYDLGYSHGMKKAVNEYGQTKGIAHVERATAEEIKKWGRELYGWCDCGSPIEGRWIGWANFCPWCGKIIKWEKEDDK